MSDTGTVTVGGTSSFTTCAANATTTMDSPLSLRDALPISNGATGDATVVNATALDLATSSVGGNLSATATTGNVTDSGTGTVGGAASFTATNANDDINLGTLAVTGPITLSTNGATGNATIV